MKTVLLETPVSAPVEVVWDVLTDLPRYGEWNPFSASIEGDLQPGAQLRATSQLPAMNGALVQRVAEVAADDREPRKQG